MSTTTATTDPVPDQRWWVKRFVTRRLDRYPDTWPRIGYLAIVVLTTIMLYYLYYVEGAVTPRLLPYYHMSFAFFLYLLVVSNAIGAFSAFIGGLSDRIGRANLTIFGTLLVAIIQLFAIPHITDKWGFAAAYCVIGFVEGVILVSTPALMRDFSPQMGRGVAMGFWALGPTMGALCASVVATNTLDHLYPWQDQFIISGLVCLGVVIISFLFLRELSPQLRDQLMVSERERALVEAKAMGLDVEAATAHPIRSMFKLDLVSSSIAISVFLLFYYASVSVLTIYWVVTFNRTAAQANGINVWLAAALSIGLVVAGFLSDLARVRKPFMLLGAGCGIVMMLFLIHQTGQPHAGYYSNVLVIVLLAASISLAYAPWMANYTEQVEHHNPALTASGLAIWGWILRITVALSFLVLPYVITTSTVLVDNQNAGAALQTIQAAQPYAPNTTALKCSATPAPANVIANLRTAPEARPELNTLATILESCNSTHNLLKAISAAGGLTNPHVLGLNAFNPLALDIQNGKQVTLPQIAGVAKYSPNLANLLFAEAKLIPAQKTSPGEWKRWWTVCLIGMAVFAVLVFFMRGRWSPRAARRDLAERDRLVSEELAKLAIQEPAHV
ncbi:MAG TPA: MFS transporter [Acidimicrobiales bacterium]|jgi:MFS family permease|nr:MFS transporter [Acidimicrobiales bacterium]